jgi:hypothetical protein
VASAGCVEFATAAPGGVARHLLWTLPCVTEGWRPAILIIEPRQEVADAIAEVVASAHYEPIVRPYLESLEDIGTTIAAIVVRVVFEGVSEPAHAAIGRLPPSHPPVIAIAWQEDESAEASRLNCDVILRGPRGISQLCEVLKRVTQA